MISPSLPESEEKAESEPSAASDSVQKEYSEATALNPKAVLFAMGALAAVGAALVASVSLSDMAELNSADRSDALIAAAVGLAAVFGAIFVAFLSQIKNDRTFDRFRRHRSVRRHAEKLGLLSGRYSSLDELAEKYETVQIEWAAAWRAHLDDIDGSDSAKRLAAAEDRMAMLEEPISTVLQSSNFFLTRRRALRLGCAIFGFALIAGASLLVFTSKSSQAESERASPTQQPTTVRIHLLSTGLAKLQALSGGGCLEPTVDGLLLSVSGSVPEVVTLETAACPPARMMLESQDGLVTQP